MTHCTHCSFTACANGKPNAIALQDWRDHLNEAGPFTSDRDLLRALSRGAPKCDADAQLLERHLAGEVEKGLAA